MAWLRIGAAAVAAAVAYRAASQRRAQGEPPPAVAWNRVRDLARLISPAGSIEMAVDYPATVRQAQAQIGELTGWNVQRDLGAVALAVDRHTWLDRLIPRMRTMTADLEAHYHESVVDSPGTWLARDLAASAMAVPLGTMFGMLSSLVLGQYDIELIAAPKAETELLLVEPNLERVVKQYNLPAQEFRHYICLHETGHAFQFEVFPWFRAALVERIQQIIARVLSRANQQKGLSWDFVQAAIGGEGGDPELRAALDVIQGRMALAEGTSNFLMNRIGSRVLPNYDQIAEVTRRRSKSVTRQVLGMLGMQRKFEQYALGEQFITAIVERRGLPALTQAWQSAETAPSFDEIREPERWLSRVS